MKPSPEFLEDPPGAAGLLAVMQRLTALADGQSEALKALDFAELERLEQEKPALMQDYAARMRALADDPGQLAALPAATRGRLEMARVVLVSALETSMARIEAVQEGRERAMGVIVAAMKRSAEQQRGLVGGYGPGARQRPGSLPLSGGINRCI